MTERAQRAWINRAHTRWLKDAGNSNLRTCIEHSAPNHASEDEKTAALALCIAYCHTLYTTIAEIYSTKSEEVFRVSQ